MAHSTHQSRNRHVQDKPTPPPSRSTLGPESKDPRLFEGRESLEENCGVERRRPTRSPRLRPCLDLVESYQGSFNATYAYIHTRRRCPGVSSTHPSYVHAQPAPPPSAESIAAIHDGKAEVNGVLYHYLLAKGRGDPVVLLHGWGSTRTCGDM